MEDASAPVDAFEVIADVMPRILALLGPRDLARLARTSRYLRDMADEPALWRECLAHEGLMCAVPLAVVDAGNWKEAHRAKRPVASLHEWVTAPTEGAALLLPSGRYAGFQLGATSPLVAIVGLPNAHGEPVVIAGAPPHNLLELTGAGLVLRHVTLRFPEAPPPVAALRAWPAVAYVANGRLEMEDCRIEGGARQWGVAAQFKASVVMRRCVVTNLLDSPLSLWEGCKAELDACELLNVGQMQLRAAEAHFRRCTMLLKDAYEARLCFVGQGSVAHLDECRLTGRGHRCSGVSSWGAVQLTRCSLDGFYFALTKREEPAVTVTECKFSAHPRGGNAFLSSGRGPVLFTQCDFNGAFTSAIEVEEHGSLRLSACRFAKAQCGVGLHGADSTAVLDACVFRECDTALKTGFGARAQPRDCSFVRCERGVHLTGDAAALQGEEAALRLANVFERCAAAVYVEAMEGGEAGEDGVAPEVKQAVARGVCTFQVTGPHYRKQMVWRCNTCRLNNSRGICIVCKELCHAGHELEPSFETVRFFCDCGAERFCDTLRRAGPPALH